MIISSRSQVHKHASPKIPAHQAREIATLAQVDPRTVLRAVHGLHVRPMALARIERALKERGLGHLLPGEYSAKAAAR